MQQHQNLLETLLTKGNKKGDRTGTGTRSIFGHQMRFDLAEGFPLVTTKKVHLKSVIYELLWMLKGDTNIKYLNDNGVSIWDEWADENGDLGPVYGHQWVKTSGDIFQFKVECDRRGSALHTAHEQINQIASVIDSIKNNPDDRGHIVCSWNVAELPKMRLRPCHCLFQFYVADGKLSCQLYQRSADTFLGLPFNIASYALLTHMIAQQCDLDVGELIWTGGDVHLYNNHIEQAELQITRVPYALPTLDIVRKPDSVFDYRFEDFEIRGYEHHPAIKAEVSV